MQEVRHMLETVTFGKEMFFVFKGIKRVIVVNVSDVRSVHTDNLTDTVEITFKDGSESTLTYSSVVEPTNPADAT